MKKAAANDVAEELAEELARGEPVTVTTPESAPKPQGRSGGGRPAAYKNAEGKRLPSVTTVTKRFQKADGLIHWAWMIGTEGKDYRDVRDEAGAAGKLAHAWIEDYLLGRERRPLDPKWDAFTVAQAEQGFAAFLEWARRYELEVLETEMPMVSERYQYGGTLDVLARVAGRIVIVDWKTGNAIYGEVLAQQAGYRQLVRETRPHWEVEGAEVLRLGKEFADFHHHFYPPAALDLGWEYFALVRQAYELDKRLAKVAA